MRWIASLTKYIENAKIRDRRRPGGDPASADDESAER